MYRSLGALALPSVTIGCVLLASATTAGSRPAVS
jgi:hypothetical protein